jgi:hypothetical protein
VPTKTLRSRTPESIARAIKTAPDTATLLDLAACDLSGPGPDERDAVHQFIRHGAPNVSCQLHAGRSDKALDAAARITHLYELAPDCDLTDSQLALLHRRMLITAALLDRMADLPSGKHTPEEWHRQQTARATELRNRILAQIEARPEEIADAVQRINIDPGLVLSKP